MGLGVSPFLAYLYHVPSFAAGGFYPPIRQQSSHPLVCSIRNYFLFRLAMTSSVLSTSSSAVTSL